MMWHNIVFGLQMANRSEITGALLGDGSSDRVLEYPIRWLLRELCPSVAVQLAWADLSKVPKCPHGSVERISAVVSLYPADILFVHRDAEGVSRDERVREIEAAAAGVMDGKCPPLVCVVPVRMTEAWFMFNEHAIREAAGNPNGNMRIQLPPLKGVAREPDPKRMLRELLVEASGLGTHRRSKFRVAPAFHRLAQVIGDYAPLRNLAAFLAFEADLQDKLSNGGWLTT